MTNCDFGSPCDCRECRYCRNCGKEGPSLIREEGRDRKGMRYISFRCPEYPDCYRICKVCGKSIIEQHIACNEIIKKNISMK